MRKNTSKGIFRFSMCNLTLLFVICGISHAYGSETETNDTVTLNEVEVNARQQAVKYDGTTINIDVSKDPMMRDRNVIDLLNLVAGVTAEKDGAVTVYGTGCIVKINGKTLKLSGTSLGLYLQSIQGSNIKNIKIDTTKSASTEGIHDGGVIDITLDKRYTHGYATNIGIDYTRMAKNAFTETAAFTLFTPRITTYANLSCNQTSYSTSFNESMESHESGNRYNSHSRTPDARRNSYVPRVGIDIDLAPSHIFGGEWAGSYNNGKSGLFVSEMESWDNKGDLSSSRTTGRYNIRSEDNIFTLNYKWDIDTIGSNLMAIADYSMNHFKSDS